MARHERPDLARPAGAHLVRAGRPVEEVTDALRAELRVAGLDPADLQLPGAVRYAMGRAAQEIAAGDRPSILRGPAVRAGAGRRDGRRES